MHYFPVKAMKRYLWFLILIPFFYSCGTGGGGGATGGDSGDGNNVTGYKPNPACSSTSSVAKVKIKEDGVYRITYLDLYNTCIGLDGVDPDTLKMMSQGEEIAIDVVDYNDNGRFDDGDSIEFYGRAIPRDDSRFKYTETNVYWLSADGGTGKRMEPLLGDPATAKLSSSFVRVLHREEDSWYEQKNYPEISLPGDVREHWFWGEVFYTPGLVCGTISLDDCKTYPQQSYYFQRDYNFSTPNLDKDRPVYLKLRLQSVSGSHHIKGYINNQSNLVIDETWSDQGPYKIVKKIPPAYLKSMGVNILRLENVGDTPSGIYDIFYLDWFEVSYSHTYQVEYDMLEFTGEGRIDISGFTSSSISVYEILDPLNVKKVVPTSTGGSSASGYTVTFSYSAGTEGRFFALTAAQKKSPLSIEAYTPADIRSKNANYIVIAHKDLYDSILSLAEYRIGKGHTVLTVKVEDIYDEFGHGIETPQAIKDFLAYAYHNWSTKPEFVLFVGDATLDYKDISGYGKDYGVKSYVPAYFVNYPGLGEVPSDNWFVDVDSANGILPEMHIGRIPAKTPSDVTAVVNKIISQETSPSSSTQVLLIADYDPTYMDDQIFETLSESVASLIPGNYNVTRLYQRDDPDNFKTGIISAINSNPLIVNYTGHGSVVNWTKEDAFSSGDVSSLTNTGYPFVVALNCLNGYFVLPDDGVTRDGMIQSPSIAESFLLAQGKGAMAVFAASAIGYPSEHDPLAQELYGILFSQDIPLGEAVTKAKETAYKNGQIMEDVVETFIFFGDPATRLR